MEKKKKNEKKDYLEELTLDYGFNSGSSKWFPQGAELLQLINQEVVCIIFKKNKDGNSETESKRAFINDINKFDKDTNTYVLEYKLSDENDDIRTERIIPEGFSFDIVGVGAGLQDNMKRFIPMSIHCRMLEESFLFDRVKYLWDKKDTLSLGNLAEISEHKKQGELLNYSRNIQAVIKTVTGETLTFRISRLKLHRGNKKDYWRIIFSPSGKEKSFNVEFNKDDKKYNLLYFGQHIGELKLIDLAQ